MIGKIVAENLLTAYTELYYRVIFCGKSTRKFCVNQRASSRKNATEKITICHGKMILISTHYNVYNIIYVYTENHTEKR